MTPEHTRADLGPVGPQEGVSTLANWISEFLAVSYLVGVTLGAIDGDKKKVMIPALGIGFCVMGVNTVGVSQFFHSFI